MKASRMQSCRAAWAAVEFGTMTADYPTLPGRLLQAIDRYASPRAKIHKQGGQWLPITGKEMLRRIAGLSQSLANLGVAQGDRVALFAPNCPEWHVADFAALGLFVFLAQDGIRDHCVTGVQTCALPIYNGGYVLHNWCPTVRYCTGLNVTLNGRAPVMQDVPPVMEYG